MYEQTDKMQIRALDFRGWLLDGKICESNTGKLIFKIRDETIVLRKNGVELHQGKKIWM